MIVAFVIAAQLAAAGPAPSLVVRSSGGTVRVPIVSSANGPMLRPEALAPTLPISVHHDSATTYDLELWGVRLELEAGVPLVHVNNAVRPLATAPVVAHGHLLVPLQLVSEIFPSVVPNTRWDADSGQLVVFTGQLSPPARSGGGDAGAGASAATSDPTSAPTSRSAPHAASGGTHGDSRLPVFPPKRGEWRVVVDAGHGGVDNGMSGPIGAGPRIHEKNITLAVAMKLGAALQARGVDVVYTRTTDTLIALDDRGRIANEAGGDLFLSIHVNAANPNWKDPGAARGFETYFLSEAKTEDARRVEQMENSAARFETGGDTAAPSDALSFIVNDMVQNEHLRESSDLAAVIQRDLKRAEPGPSRGVKQAAFRVLVTAYMPAVLVEIGFGSNPSDARYISDPDGQEALATTIADATVEYLRAYGRRKTAAALSVGADGVPR